MMRVQEMFISVEVSDMQRAVTFYMNALGARVEYASPTWSSLVIAGVRVSLAQCEQHGAAPPIGLHLIVDDVALVCAAVACAGGEIEPAIETSHGIVIARVSDTEGNTFTLRQGPAASSVPALGSESEGDLVASLAA